jgi:hypothetical protein
MKKIFNFDEYNDHDLYHCKFGRGAVIIAVPKNSDEKLKLAKCFNSKDQDNPYAVVTLNPIVSIEEMDGFVKVKFKVEKKNNSDCPGEIVRVITTEQITFEIVC